jgi:FAD synthase
VQSNDTELKSQLIVSGSFNPVHLGHVKLLDASMRTLQATHGAYELSAFNADKPPLTIDVILERAAQFAGKLLSDGADQISYEITFLRCNRSG